MIANAQWYPYVVDTLPKRVINGLEVIPIRKTYESGEFYPVWYIPSILDRRYKNKGSRFEWL